MLSSNNQSKKFETSRWNGTLSRAEFQIAASTFADQWNQFNSGLLQCSWVPCPNPPWLPPSSQVEGYLSVERVILPSTTEDFSRQGDGELGEEELSCSDNESFIDNVTLAQNLGLERHYYDFHVVYSVSYRVPVLYFRACHSDGQPLALDDIEKDIPANHGKVLMESKWTFITQEDVFVLVGFEGKWRRELICWDSHLCIEFGEGKVKEKEGIIPT